MPTTYSITIQNRSGAPQDYAFFSTRPVVSGGASGEVWSNVIKSARNTPDMATCRFEFSDNYYAVCGSYEGTPDHGVRLAISKAVPVTLGTRSGVNVNMGSTVKLVVAEQTVCDLIPSPNPGQGKIGNFQLDTAVMPGNQFLIADARKNNLLVGVGIGKEGGDATPIGTFIPYPNAKYQIMPQTSFQVSVGEKLQVGELVKPEMLGSTLAVDFSTRGTAEVILIHGGDNTLSFA